MPQLDPLEVYKMDKDGMHLGLQDVNGFRYMCRAGSENTDDELLALAIAKFEFLVAVSEKNNVLLTWGAFTCPLCVRYATLDKYQKDLECIGCPINADGKHKNCQNTPYYDLSKATTPMSQRIRLRKEIYYLQGVKNDRD